jgi:2-polyprenyl-3-methyl-5-hydroxy-6-metoxy-1,4-benzoquinol methylase
MDLVNQDYWDKSYEKNIPSSISPNNPIIEWIRKISSLCPDGDCLEVGVYPGGYINEFGKLGYRINGIDLTPKVNELKNDLQKKGYNIGEFFHMDFLDYKPDRKFNLVYSIGFIEHFIDFKSVIDQHCKLVDNSGLLFIVVPNFKGYIQYYLHKIFDNENLKRHNIYSMDPNEWKETLKNNGFEIIEQGYIGHFDFWMDISGKNYFKIIIRRFFIKIMPLISKILKKPSSLYSPYCGIIAKKISN